MTALLTAARTARRAAATVRTRTRITPPMVVLHQVATTSDLIGTARNHQRSGRPSSF